MLKSQETNAEQTPPPISVAQARVTPNELSAALAAIEARRQAEAARLAGTIPIEEAVSSLHLDSTPDEIWAEVQAQRAKAETERSQTVNKTFAAADAARREQLRLTQAAAQARSRQVVAPPRVKRDRRWMGIFTPFLLIWLLAQVGIIPQFWHHHSPPAVHVAQLTPLSTVPDGKDVYADNAALVQIAEGTSPAKITVDQNGGGNTWKVYTQGGHTYLRGYILNTDSLATLQGKPLNVFNDDNSGDLEGETTSQITVRLDKTQLQKSGGDDNFSEVTIPNFHPDPMTSLSPWR